MEAAMAEAAKAAAAAAQAVDQSSLLVRIVEVEAVGVGLRERSARVVEVEPTAALRGIVERFPDRPAMWPLLIGAWKRKPTDAGTGGPEAA